MGKTRMLQKRATNLFLGIDLMALLELNFQITKIFITVDDKEKFSHLLMN